MTNYSHQYNLPFTFDGQKTGLAMGDFFLGYGSTLTNGPVAAKNKRAERLGLYFADTWKVNPKWTLSYGSALGALPSQHRPERAQEFNVTNSFRINNPVTNLNSGNFGQVVSAQDPRIMQFALRWSDFASTLTSGSWSKNDV